MYKDEKGCWREVPAHMLLEIFEGESLVDKREFNKLKTFIEKDRWASVIKNVEKYGIVLSYRFRDGTWDVNVPPHKPNKECNSIW